MAWCGIAQMQALEKQKLKDGEAHLVGVVFVGPSTTPFLWSLPNMSTQLRFNLRRAESGPGRRSSGEVRLKEPKEGNP